MKLNKVLILALATIISSASVWGSVYTGHRESGSNFLQADAKPGMVEAVARLYRLQGEREPAHFAALPFSMTAEDTGRGYLYNFLGQSGDSRLAYAGDNYLVTMERVFGRYDHNVVALHFWDARTFAYKSSILHNGMLVFTPMVIDKERHRFAIAFHTGDICNAGYAIATQGALAYNLNTGELEYTTEFDDDGGSGNTRFRSPEFADLPPFKAEETADNILLSNSLQLQQIPQFAGLASHFTATDENTIRRIDFNTLRTRPLHPSSTATGELSPEDIPNLPAGMKIERIGETEPEWAPPHYRLCKPEQETRTMWELSHAIMDDKEKKPPLFLYDTQRQKLHPLPMSAIDSVSSCFELYPTFGESNCGKITYNALLFQRWTEWSGPELLNNQTGEYEQIIFNGKKREKYYEVIVAYDIATSIPESALVTMGSQLSVWYTIPGDSEHTYWLAAGEGYCALFRMDETTKTGKLVQSWQGSWGKSRWTPNCPAPAWLPDKNWLCLPMKSHCWEVYDMADPTTPTEKKFSIYTGADSAWVIVLPDGRYAGTPGCENMLYEIDEENVVRSLQAKGLWRNRPAEVLEAIGGNADDIAALKETTKRWLARKGMDINNMPPEPTANDFPHAKADSTPLRPESDLLEFDVELTAASKKALTTLSVRADGAIIPQEWDKSLLILPGQQQTVRVKIPLRAGQNNIELIPIDSMALAGEPIRFRAVRPRNTASKLFVVALGVSDYDDDSLDLQFAAKDAKDLAAAFAEHGSGEVKCLALTDKEVANAEVLERVREFLTESTPDDRVVLYLAGHGMLDDKLDYHYAPASFDVENVSKTGISMSRLTGMLQSIPARERLLLLDTCHSGQLGEAGEEKLAANGVQLPHGVRAIQHRGMKVKKATGALTTAAQQKRYIEDMFNMGNEYRGVNIVAGAAGAEYALESGEWNNGVFTAAIIQTLQNAWKADQNVDGQLAVDELLHALQNRVQEMTGGAQSPNIVAAENSGMQLTGSISYDMMQGNWAALCKRIRKAKSPHEARFILDEMIFYRFGNIHFHSDLESTRYGEDTYLSQRGRDYDDTQQEHLKKAFLLGQKSRTENPEDVPICVWQTALEQGVTPEDIFYICNYTPQLLRLLLEKGLSPDMKTPDGDPLLLEVGRRGDASQTRLLLESGANPNSQDYQGNTLLHIIAKRDKLDSHTKQILQHLFRHGADCSVSNNQGEPALSRFSKHYRVIRAIEKRVRQENASLQAF